MLEDGARENPPRILSEVDRDLRSDSGNELVKDELVDVIVPNDWFTISLAWKSRIAANCCTQASVLIGRTGSPIRIRIN